MTMLTVTTADAGQVQITFEDEGAGQPFLLLHGGAGPQSVAKFAGMLTASGRARAITPVHPGFAGTPRPEGLTTMNGLAEAYAALLDALDLREVIVVGNSVGGWIAAEIALLHSDRVSGIVLVDAAGLQLDEHPIADFFSLTMDQVADLSYFQPDTFRIDVSRLPDSQKAAMAGNRAALQVYGGTSMADPSLLGRLASVATPVLVVWGAADRIVPPEHGMAYATAIPGGRLEIIETAGHLPQLETPEILTGLVQEFAAVAAAR